MNFRLFKIFTILVSFLFLTGFTPFISILGPGVTAITSGNIYKATAQFIIDQSIKKKDLAGILFGIIGGLILLEVWEFSIQELSKSGNLFFIIARFYSC